MSRKLEYRTVTIRNDNPPRCHGGIMLVTSTRKNLRYYKCKVCNQTAKRPRHDAVLKVAL